MGKKTSWGPYIQNLNNGPQVLSSSHQIRANDLIWQSSSLLIVGKQLEIDKSNARPHEKPQKLRLDVV